jgi:hypothetical protein
MGIDVLSGGSFYADPFGWVLRDDVPVTNPNVICFGKPGRGKSATTKAFLLRMMDFGYRALVLGDPKDEYEPLCTFFGVDPIRIGPGLPARINPLSFGPLAAGWDTLDRHGAHTRAGIVFGRWLTLIRGLVGSQRIGATPVPFGPVEEQVVKAALRDLTGYTTGATHLVETTIPALWHQLTTPTPQLIERAGTPAPGSSSTRPGCCATPSASSSTGPWPDCSTPTPPSTSTGTPPSPRCPCPG